jgi:acetyl coenzyme A synthetase (ADP forming)-like protein
MFILEPKSVALIGASAEEKKLGHYILKNLLESGFKGKIYPVNPKHDELMKTQCYHSISDIKEAVDMAVIVTPASMVPALAEECGKKKVKTLVVISAGFGETGTDEGKKAEAELKKICDVHDMSIVGPNCLGVLRPSIGLNASFAATPEKAGDIALISQSGAMAVALLDAAAAEHLHFSFIASIGNKTDLGEVEFLEICEKDPKTKVIGLYLESIKDGQKFVETAKRMGTKKPIVLIKAGMSARGAKAVSSHTGALAGSSAALIAACRDAGIHRAEDTRQFLSLLTLLRGSPPLLSRSIAVVTNAGGPGVLATDATERAGLKLADLDAKTVARLKKALPPAASTANPVDVLGDALDDRYAEALDACGDDPTVDGIAALLTPQVMTPCDKIAKALIGVARGHPMIPITASFMGGQAVESAKALLRAEGIACFETPEEAVSALASLLPSSVRTDDGDDPKGDDRAAAARQLLKSRRGLLNEELSAELFGLYDLPVPEQAVATDAKNAVEIAEQVGYPVIAKVSSPDILHKTDVGGVRANLKTADEVKSAFADILKACGKNAPKAAVKGVLIQKMLPVGSEFIVGGLRDDSFGPLVMAGLGGIYTELFKDTSFRLGPVSSKTAYEMLTELQSWKLLTGMRGKGALDIDALAATIVKVSNLMCDCPSISEIDLNPVFVIEKGVTVADTKVVVE